MGLLDGRYPSQFQPIYLHFLDRELRESLGNAPPPVTLEAAIRVILLATPAPLYCGLAPAWEGTNDSLAQLLGTLVASRQVEMLSHHADFGEFLASKQVAYEHDTVRYPMYFGNEQASRQKLRTTRFKRSSATQELIIKLNDWTVRSPDMTNDRYYMTMIDQPLKSVVRRRLEGRKTEAVTYAMFRPGFIGTEIEKNPLAAGHLRREISAEYLDHYLDEGAGDIATGTAGLEFFDNKARFFPLHDIELFAAIFRRVGLGALSRGAPPEMWEQFVACRGGQIHRHLASEMRLLIAGISGLVPSSLVARPGQRFYLREALQRRLQASRSLTAQPTKIEDLLVSAIASVADGVRDGENDASFAIAVSMMKEAIMSEREIVLLVTATQVEIEHAVKVFGGELVRKQIGDHTYYLLGELGGCDVVAVKCAMGSGGPGGSQATATDAIRDLKPSAVVMVGIAFGMDKRSQAIGDILLSRQLQPYELQRVGKKRGKENNIQRGPRVDVPVRIVDRFESGILDWHGPKVRPGLVLSGEKLVDSPDFKRKLLAMAPEAVGGEMEGAGLYAAAYMEKVDWIVIKAIADWAEGKDDHAQKDAARNAIEFVHHVLSHGGLAIGVR
jgi:nucleoside phosphorylase